MNIFRKDPPRGHDRRAPAGQKVVDIVRARQRDEGARAYFKNYHVERDNYRMVLCSNGRVYMEVIGAGGVVAQIDLDATEAEQLRQNIMQMQQAQRRLHEHRRGANLWVARAHPTHPSWLMVSHNDCDTPFKPITCQARRERKGSDGHDHAPDMPRCSACGKSFTPGENAFEATRAIHNHWGGLARICKGCTQPPRDGLMAIEGTPSQKPAP